MRYSIEYVARLVYILIFFFFFFASRARARAGPGVRGTSLCEARGRAQFPLLPHESAAACGCNSREREETPPSLNATMSPCHPCSLWASYERIPIILGIYCGFNERREGGGAPDGHLGGGSSTASRGRGREGRRLRDK